MLSWINRDGKLIILSLGIRTLAQSAASLILAVYLDKLGYSLVQIGAFLSAGVAGSATLTFIVSLIAERVGRRRLMVLFAAVTGIAGPGGAVPGKPVGTVWLGWALRGTPARAELQQLSGDRAAVRDQSVQHALQRVVSLLEEDGGDTPAAGRAQTP